MINSIYQLLQKSHNFTWTYCSFFLVFLVYFIVCDNDTRVSQRVPALVIRNSVSMVIQNDQLAPATVDVILKQNWNRAVIFHDAEHADSLSLLVKELDKRSRRTVLYQVIKVPEALQHTEDLVKQLRLANVFIALCTQPLVTTLMKHLRVTDLNSLGPKHFWLLPDYSSINKSVLVNVLRDGDNVLILTQDDTNRELECCSVDLFTLSAFTISSVTKLVFLDIGYWFESQFHTHGPIFPFGKGGFWNRTFQVMTLKHAHCIRELGGGKFGGFCITMLNALSASLNFSYVLTSPEDGKWGSKKKNGKFSGMIGALQDKKIDLAVGGFTITHERSEVVDFTTPFMMDKTLILMKRMDLATSKLFLCLRPFAYFVWGMLILSIVVVSFLAWLIDRFRPDNKTGKSTYGGLIYLLHTHGSILQRTKMVSAPHLSSSRAVVGGWLWFGFVIASVYSGNLTAFLTAPSIYVPANNLEELAESGLQFGSIADTALHSIIVSGKGKIYQKLRSGLNLEDPTLFTEGTKEGLLKVLTDKNYAFLTEEMTYSTLHIRNYSFLRNNDCAFVRSKETFYPQPYAFALQKNSPYTEIISLKILMMLEAGVIGRDRKIELEGWKTGGCTGLERMTEQKNVALIEAQGTFYILGIGLVASGIFFIIEFLRKIFIGNCELPYY